MVVKEDIKEIKMEECTTCIHHDICKYVSNMKSLKNTIASTLNLQDIEETENGEESKAPFVINLKCLKKSETSITRGEIVRGTLTIPDHPYHRAVPTMEGNPQSIALYGSTTMPEIQRDIPNIVPTTATTTQIGNINTKYTEASHPYTQEKKPSKKLAPPPAIIPLDPRVEAPVDIDDYSPSDVETKVLSVK